MSILQLTKVHCFTMFTGRKCFPDQCYDAEAPVRLVIKKGSLVDYSGIMNRNLEKGLVELQSISKLACFYNQLWKKHLYKVKHQIALLIDETWRKLDFKILSNHGV